MTFLPRITLISAKPLLSGQLIIILNLHSPLQKLQGAWVRNSRAGVSGIVWVDALLWNCCVVVMKPMNCFVPGCQEIDVNVKWLVTAKRKHYLVCINANEDPAGDEESVKVRLHLKSISDKTLPDSGKVPALDSGFVSSWISTKWSRIHRN